MRRSPELVVRVVLSWPAANTSARGAHAASIVIVTQLRFRDHQFVRGAEPSLLVSQVYTSGEFNLGCLMLP